VQAVRDCRDAPRVSNAALRDIATAAVAKIWWWVAGTLALVAVTLVFVLLPLGAPAAWIPAGTPPAANPSDIQFGPAAARVTLFEYGDFECLLCADYAPIMRQLRLDYGDRVLFVFRFVPLVQHEYGMASAQAGYAAYLQGRFWEMSDLLYARQAEWSQSDNPYLFFVAYAEVLGLNVDEFARAADVDTTIRFITDQKSAGLALGLKQTPSFFLDGRWVLPRSYNEFKVLIDEALDKAG